MAEDPLQGKAMAAVARDIADGYVVLNPLVMKNFSMDTYRALYQQIRRVQTGVRSEKFPFHDAELLRKRNHRLQRLHQAMVVLQHSAKQKRIVLY